MSIPEMVFKLNESAKPKKCTACDETKSFPIYEDEAPDNTQFRIEAIILADNKMVGSLGHRWAEAYQCLKCGHIDFYSWGVRRGSSLAR
jgi:hypothetical protein